MQFFPLFKLAEENIKSFSPSSLSLISTAWKGVTQHIGCNILVSCVLHRSFVSNFFGNLEQGRKTQYSVFGNLNNEEKKPQCSPLQSTEIVTKQQLIYRRFRNIKTQIIEEIMGQKCIKPNKTICNAV